MGCSLGSRYGLGKGESWLGQVSIDCILNWWLLWEEGTRPKWPYIICSVTRHYTCTCLACLLKVELMLLQTDVLVLSYREVPAICH